MSWTKSATRRLGLLAGSSLSIAGLVGVAGLLTAGSAAVAAVNPCGETPSGDGVIVCPQGAYPTGIEHTSDGDLDVTVHPLSNFGSGGVITTAGNPTDDLTVKLLGQVTASNTDIATTAPIVLDTESQQGDILVDIAVTRTTSSFAGLRNNGANGTHFVKAISTNGGDVTVTRSEGSGQVQATGANGVAAIEARSIGGGDVTVGSSGTGTLTTSGNQYGVLASVDGGGVLTVNVSGAATGANGIAGISVAGAGNSTLNVGATGTGRLYGIRAEATGATSVSITGNGTASNAASVAGIWVKSGTAPVTISGNGTSSTATGIYVEAQGNVDITGNATGGVYGIDLTNVAGKTSNIVVSNVSGGTAAIRAAGAGALNIDVVGVLNGGFDFTSLSSAPSVTFGETAEWGVGAAPMTVDTVDGLTLDFTGTFVGRVQMDQVNLDSWEAPMVVNFTGAEDIFVNSGTMIMGQRIFAVDALLIKDDPEAAYGYNPRHYEAEIRFVGLEEFRHSGLVLFGTFYKDRTDLGTDGWYDDILAMPGTHWVGEGGELQMDVHFTAAPADDCTREAVTGDLGGADCLILTGGSTEGVTYVTVKDPNPFDRGAFNSEGWLLVDVSGGTSAQGHFVVGPNTVGYNPLNGGIMDKGAFAYAIAYNEDTQQHRLVSLPGPSALQFPLLADAAHELWRLSTGTVFDRQGALREGFEPRLGGGVWMRASGERADRDLIQTVTAQGQSFAFDNTYRQDSYAITGGLDLVSVTDGSSAWTVGLMAGYATSQMEYEASPNAPEFNSWNGGAYASFVSGPLFLDAAVNANRATMREDVPAFGLLPDGTLVSTRLLTVGARAEAGWRVPLGGGLFAEPLAGVSWSQSSWDDIDVPAGDAQRPAGVSIEFDDPTSLRTNLGGRLGLDFDYGPTHGQVSMLGRYWNDSEGESGVRVRNVGEDLVVVEDFGGDFAEFGVNLSVNGLDDALTGFFNFGGKFGDDYQSQNVTAGVRVNW